MFPEGNRIEEKIRASIDLDFWSAASCGDFFEAGGNGLGHSVQALRGRCSFALRRHRLSCIAAEPNPWVNLNFAEHRDAIFDRRLRAFSVTENIHGFAAVRASKGAHVFHDAEYFHAYLAKHFDGLTHIRERDG